MPNKTLYIAQSDIPTWDRAKAIAETVGDNISNVIVGYLEKYVADCGVGVDDLMAAQKRMREAYKTRTQIINEQHNSNDTGK